MDSDVGKKNQLNTIVDDLFSEFNEEKIQLKTLLCENKKRNEEIDSLIVELMREEDSNYRLFSPRERKTKNENRIISLKEEKRKLQEENEEIEKKLFYYENKEKKISILNTVVEKQDYDNKHTFFDINETIVKVQEIERKRIARDLHDSTVQNLAHIIHKIDLSSKFIETDVTRTKIEMQIIKKDIKQIVSDMRKIIYDLQPTDFSNKSFSDEIDKLVQSLSDLSNIVYQIDIVDSIDDCDNYVLVTVINIIKEAFINSIKYSKAKHIMLKIEKIKSDIVIHIEDDGIGIDFDIDEMYDNENTENFGIKIMKERTKIFGGKFEIASGDEGGTVISVHIPYLVKGV